MNRVRLGVLLSGSGRTLQNLLERIAAGTLDAEIAVVISDRPGVKGLDRAADAGLPHFVERTPAASFELLRRHDVELVCLCGYLRLLSPIPDDFAHRILNIHPALLPKFGGAGYHGAHVHRAVLEAGETESGCTVHECDDEYDHGPILLQRRVAVMPNDTVDTLAARVFDAECEAYPEAIAAWSLTRPAR